MIISELKTAIDCVARLVNLTKTVTNHATPASIADIAKLTRVEPLVIVSPDCMNLDYMPSVNQSLLSLFCAYYLQAVNILSSVQNVEVVKFLDKLNPNRDSTGFLLSDSLRKENRQLQYSLPVPGVKMRMEAVKVESLNEAVNMSVGRMLEVTLSTSNENDVVTKTTLNIAIRLMVSSIPESSILSILSNGTMNSTAMERFHAYRSGQLEIIRDLILCQDMIDEKMKMAVNDTSGMGAEIHRRVANNRRFGILSNNPSLATASNIFVMSEELASQIEYKAGGKMSNYASRQKIFEASYAMIIVVINRETGRCKFFVRNQPDYATLGRKEIEMGGKGKGPDVMEIFRTLQTASFSNF